MLSILAPKTNTQIRMRYIEKLKRMKIFREEPRKKHQTCTPEDHPRLPCLSLLGIIFDWDDTLLSTTYIGSLGLVSVEDINELQIGPLDKAAHNLLEKALNFGEVYIITNAAKGWVEYSSKMYPIHHSTHPASMS